MNNKKLINQLFSFGIIGVLNTIIGTSVMYFMYNILGAGYWLSSASNYIVGSIFSYVMNKRFTFSIKERDYVFLIKFILNISLCYLVAYGVAKRFISFILGQTLSNEKNIGNISMLVGMILFVVLNFWGQKIFVFSKKEGKN
jgi:putative flippase GtrA